MYVAKKETSEREKLHKHAPNLVKSDISNIQKKFFSKVLFVCNYVMLCKECVYQIYLEETQPDSNVSFGHSDLYRALLWGKPLTIV